MASPARRSVSGLSRQVATKPEKSPVEVALALDKKESEERFREKSRQSRKRIPGIGASLNVAFVIVYAVGLWMRTKPRSKA